MTTADPVGPDAASPPATGASPPAGAGLRPTLLLCAVAAVPFVVASVALRSKPWFPTSDLAQAELRMRGFWSHPPLLGAAGRIGTLQQQGNHPGPMMFWFAWPVYRLLGRTAWAYETSILALDVGWTFAIGAAARRRGGLHLVAGVLLVLAVTVRSYHADALSQPWNPYVALVPFFLFLVLVWGVLCDDLVLLPFAVGVGSYCIQCHVGYGLVVGGLLALAVGWQATRFVRARRGGRPTEGRPLGWLAVAVGVGVVAWIPPVIDQLVHDPGNFTILYRYFSNPPETPVGYARGLHIVLVQLSPVGNWVTGSWTTTGGSVLPGLAFLVLWAVLGARAARLDGRLLRLDAALALVVVLAVGSAAQIFGDVWGYLVEWMWSVTALMVVATLWSALLLVRDTPVGSLRPRLGLVPVAGVGAVALLFSVQAAGVEPLAYVFSRQEAVLSRATAPQLDRKRRYLVVWDDPIGLGGTGFGLVLELTRRGYQAGVAPAYRAGVPTSRIYAPGAYDAVLHVETGLAILAWRADPRARELACADLRTDADRAESQQLERRLTAALERRGRHDLAARLHASLFALTLDPALPADLHADAVRLVNHAEAVAVFLSPADHLSPEGAGALRRDRDLARGTFGSSPTCRP